MTHCFNYFDKYPLKGMGLVHSKFLVLWAFGFFLQPWNLWVWASKPDQCSIITFSVSPSDSSMGNSKFRSSAVFIQKTNPNLPLPKGEPQISTQSTPSLGVKGEQAMEGQKKGKVECPDNLEEKSTPSGLKRTPGSPSLKIISVILKDENDDGILSALEKAEIVFEIQNKGNENAYRVYPKVIPTGIVKYLNIENVDDSRHQIGINYIPSLAPDAKAQLRISIVGLNTLGVFKANMAFVIVECNEKNNSSPFLIEFSTDTLREPLLVYDSLVLAKTSDNFIYREKPVTVSSKISNKNNGQAWGINPHLLFNEKEKQYISLLIDSTANAGFQFLGPQESRIFTKMFLVSEAYPFDSLTFDFCISHNSSDAPLCRSLTINVKSVEVVKPSSTMTADDLEQPMNLADSVWITDSLQLPSRTINAQSIVSNSLNDQSSSTPPSSLSDPALTLRPLQSQLRYSDVDTGIPFRVGEGRPYNYALIIGNEDYDSFQSDVSAESNVHFAIHDAEVFKEYCHRTFQVPAENIFYYTNATAGIMRQAVNKISRLIEAEKGQANVFVYYSGHGLPSETTKKPYLMPVDISGSNVEEGLALDWFYEKLTKFPTQRVLVFLDACFSGGSRSDQLLALRGVRIVPEETNLQGNLVVLSSSSAEQSSLVWKDKQHGLFTYYLLKKLKATEGDVKIPELLDYLEREVNLQAIKKFNKVQTPKMSFSPSISTEKLYQWKVNE